VKDYDARQGGRPQCWPGRFEVSDWGFIGARRVSPRERGRGTGSALFRGAGDWAEALGCRCLKIETQNVNVPAGRFYQTPGCTLGAVDRFAYRGQPAEVRLLRRKTLASPEVNSS
jgi:GNAT superfamily N-acetyltransferase